MKNTVFELQIGDHFFVFREQEIKAPQDAIKFDRKQQYEVSSILSRKKRQQQMTVYEFFHSCLMNIGKTGIEFSDYLFCKSASGIVFPEVAELQSLDGSPQPKKRPITTLEADDDTESVTTFEDYLKARELKAKQKIKNPKNLKGFVLDDDDDDDD